MTIGADGKELIAGYDVGAQHLRLVTCSSADCGSLTNSRIDFGSDVGQYPSIALGDDGTAVIAYYDATAGDLKIAIRDGLPGTGDRTIAQDVTDGAGAYDFGSQPAGSYMVSAHSRDAEPTTGYAAGGAGDVWAEQTFGPTGSFCADGSGGTASASGAAGVCYGGRRATTSDGSTLSSVSISEHVALVDAAIASVSNVDFGFSFNVVVKRSAGNRRP